jgi:hypothetical protein
VDHKPDDAVLFDLLAVWAPAEATRNGILVTKPGSALRFLEAARPDHCRGASTAL